MLSLTRAIGENQPDLRFLRGALRQFRMPLYKCRTPDGYANTQTTWLNPVAITHRLSLATLMSRGRGGSGNAVDADQLGITLGHPFSDQTQTVVESSPPRLRAALMLGSPEFMYR